MQTYVFLDLDDTLFQTRPKCPRDEPTSPAAYSRDGAPLSYITDRQRALFSLLSTGGTVIPTTARNRDAFRRVILPFRSFAILNFGGTILTPGGAPDAEWDERVRPQATSVAGRLEALCRSALDFIHLRGLGVTARVITDLDMPLYLVMKHPGGDADALRHVAEEHLAGEDLTGFFVHHNDNNLSLVPRFLGKEKAVAFLLDRRLPGPALALGIGDSLSDAAFLGLCDFAMVPRRSQLAARLLASGGREPPDGLKDQGADAPRSPGSAFSGSYDPDDVTLLLKPVEVPSTPVHEKERLIQSGARHYSEMITHERAPSSAYLQVFHEGLQRAKTRFARDLITLVRGIARHREGPVTLLSLARAGTPIGVLVARALRHDLNRDVAHYSLSIIRDRGIDENALRHVLARRPAASVVFVDGWTGKGVIAAELARAVTEFNTRHGTDLDPGLYTVADLCGAAKFAATTDDYLIPSAVLGATVSGLVSRSILSAEVVGPDDFHGCVHYRELAREDLSRWFADTMTEEMARQWNLPAAEVSDSLPLRAELQRRNAALLADLGARYAVREVNHVKPGVGEATRVLLRRVPGRLLLRDATRPEVAHLRLLAQEKGVPVTVEAGLPYLAVALIEELEV